MAIWISFLSGKSNYWVGCRLAISLWIKPLRWSASLQPDWWQCKRRQRLLRLCTIRGAIRGWALGICIKVATSFVRGMIGSIMVCGVIAPRLVCGITALVDLLCSVMRLAQCSQRLGCIFRWRSNVSKYVCVAQWFLFMLGLLIPTCLFKLRALNLVTLFIL